MESKQYAKNKAAFHDYRIIEEFEVGLVLQGWEVKSIRVGAVSLKESYIAPVGKELLIYGMNIAKWKYTLRVGEQMELRPRKLLVNRKEIEHIVFEQKRNGVTIIPLSIYDRRGHIKLKIALGKGLRKYDKREVEKSREIMKGSREKQAERW